MRIEKRIIELGLDLPVKEPRKTFDAAKRVGNVVYSSGNGPNGSGGPLFVGRVGLEVTLDQARVAARLCALNCLASLRTVVDDLDDIDEIIKVLGFVNCGPDFHETPNVMDGCSEFLIDVFGARGRHARSAIGTSNLPGNIPVEVELIASVRT